MKIRAVSGHFTENRATICCKCTRKLSLPPVHSVYQIPRPCTQGAFSAISTYEKILKHMTNICIYQVYSSYSCMFSKPFHNNGN